MSVLPSILHDQNPWWRGAASSRAVPTQRRDLEGRLLSGLLAGRGRRATVVVGPRQVGKTVVLLQLVEDLIAAGRTPQEVLYFDFSDDRLTEGVSPRDVLNAAKDLAPRSSVVLFDEIGGSKAWSLWLKQAVDAKVARFVVTDSAATLLRQSTRESGQGRWDEETLEPLSFREFLTLRRVPPNRESLNLVPDPFELFLRLGGFPEFLGDDNEQLQAKARLRADIADRAILRDLLRYRVDVARVKDLFVYLMQDSGAVFDPIARARDVRADHRPVRDWLRLLLDTLLIYELPEWHRRATASLRARPRIYAADHTLIGAFAAVAAPLDDPMTRSRMYEAAVFRYLRDVARGHAGRLSFFRPNDDLELDFLLETPSTRVGIEVTTSRLVDGKKLMRFGKACDAARVTHRVLVHGGIGREQKGNVLMVPLQLFLLVPPSSFNEGLST